MDSASHGFSSDADEEFYGFTCMSLGTASAHFPTSSNPTNSKLPFHHSTIIENIIAPADELFFKGQLLPLQLDPRLHLMKALLNLSSNPNPDPDPGPGPGPNPNPNPASADPNLYSDPNLNPSPIPTPNATTNLSTNGLPLPRSSSFGSHNSNNSSSSSSGSCSLMWESLDKDDYTTSVSSSSARDSNGSSTTQEESSSYNNNNNSHHPQLPRLGRRSSFLLLWKPLLTSFRRARSSPKTTTPPAPSTKASTGIRPSSSQRFHTTRTTSSHSEDLSKYRDCIDRHSAYYLDRRGVVLSNEFESVKVPHEKGAGTSYVMTSRSDRSMKVGVDDVVGRGLVFPNSGSCYRSNLGLSNVVGAPKGRRDSLLCEPKASEMKSKSNCRVEECHPNVGGPVKQGGKLWQGYSRKLKALYDMKIISRGLVHHMGPLRSSMDELDIREPCNRAPARSGISASTKVSTLLLSSGSHACSSSSGGGSGGGSISSMQELQSALQSAIAHCKQSNNFSAQSSGSGH